MRMRNYFKLLTLLFLLYANLHLLGQNFTITGKVLSETDSLVVPNAVVKIIDENIIVLTDSLGKFTISDLQSAEIKLNIIKIGYYPYNATVKLVENQENKFTFYVRNDLLNLNDKVSSSNYKYEYLNNSINNYRITEVDNMFIFNTPAEYLDVKNNFNVIKNRNYYAYLLKRGKINNFNLTVEDIIIPKDYYSETVMFLPMYGWNRIEINNSPNVSIAGNIKSGGSLNLLNVKRGNNISVCGAIPIEGIKSLSISTLNKIDKVGEYVDSIKTRTFFYYSPSYKYDNYYKYTNRGMFLEGEFYLKQNMDNKINLMYNKTTYEDYSPTLYKNMNVFYITNSALFTVSMKNKLEIIKNCNIVLYNNYSLVNKQFNKYTSNSFSNKHLITRLFYSHEKLGSYRFNIGVENNFIKLNYYNIGEAFFSENILCAFAEGEYNLEYGKFYLGGNINKSENNKLTLSPIAKLKIYVSDNSDMLIGYSSVYNQVDNKDNLIYNYYNSGNLKNITKNNLIGEKISTLEAVFTYSDKKYYRLKLSFYNDKIKNMLITKEYGRGNELEVKNLNMACTEINTADVELKILPFKRAMLDINLTNSKSTSDDIYSALFIPEKSINLLFTYRPFINTIAGINIKNYGNTTVSDEIDPIRNIEVIKNINTYKVNSLTTFDLMLSNRTNNYIVTLSIKNILNTKAAKYLLVNGFSILLGFEYSINY